VFIRGLHAFEGACVNMYTFACMWYWCNLYMRMCVCVSVSEFMCVCGVKLFNVVYVFISCACVLMCAFVFMCV